MTVTELIEALKALPADAAVITPGNHYGDMVLPVTEAVEVEPLILAKAGLVGETTKPVVMLRSE